MPETRFGFGFCHGYDVFVVAALTLMLAVIIGAVAWRMRCEDRRRSDARFAALVAAAAVALAVVSGSGPRRFVPIRTDRPAAAEASANAPLELLALEHDRDGDRFIVRGIVRNPAGGAIDGLAAVVSVFGRDGGLITSGRAAVPVSTLDPGAETPFVVTVSGADDVDRYHLSFRTAAGMVPHLDRRAHGVMARLP